MKPYAESCDQNRSPILEVLRPLLCDCRQLLEIGSGTGQHAVYFSSDLPHLTWQTSDVTGNHAAIHAWLDDEGPANALRPLALDVRTGPWPEQRYDAVFSANTVHIMGWEAVVALFAGVGRVLAPQGLFILYGPFNYGGRYTSESNARFDQWLKGRDPQSAIRNFEELDALAQAAGMVLVEDIEMPVNNRTLVWRKA
jgi:cyclopropane fatty-acyl-phospholipid synthase-like methyltransferase